jgi:hypothetical protein
MRTFYRLISWIDSGGVLILSCSSELSATTDLSQGNTPGLFCGNNESPI